MRSEEHSRTLAGGLSGLYGAESLSPSPPLIDYLVKEIDGGVWA